MPRVDGLGDLVSDVQGLFALTQAQNGQGGIGGYLQGLYQQFLHLPSDISTMQGQITRVGSVLTAAGADTTALGEAQRDVAQLTATLPGVQTNVEAMIRAIGPISNNLANGTITTDVIATLALEGVDIVQMFNNVQDLFQLRDDAKAKIQSAVRNPALSPQVAQDAANAFTQAGLFGYLPPIAWVIGGGILLAVLLKRRH